MCGGISANETQLNLEASVTNAENGQLARAYASTIIYEKSLRMDFSVPSPAVIHLDMPFMAWVWTFSFFYGGKNLMNDFRCGHRGPMVDSFPRWSSSH